jgi:hypothetical protein
MLTLHKATAGIALILGFALAACGGGGGSADSGSGSPSSSNSSSSSSVSSSAASSIAWHVYDGSRMPDQASAITLADGSKAAFSLSGNTGNYFSVAGGNLSLDSVNAAAATPMASFDKAFTGNSYPRTGSVLFRVTPGANFALNRSLDLRLALAAEGSFGPLIELRLSTSGQGIQLVQWNGTTTLSANTNTNPGVDLSQAHAIQLNFTLSSASSGSIQVYVDGGATPVLTASGPLRQTATAGANHLAFGDAYDAPYQSTLDWLIWTPQAYLPAQLKGKLPAGIGSTTGY